MERISFDIRAGSDQSIDAADLARKLLQSQGLSVARGVVWARGHRPVPDNARKKARQFDLLVLDDIDADDMADLCIIWQRVGAVAGANASTPWQVCKVPHSGGIPRFHEEMVRSEDEDRCNGFTNWDTWNVAGAIDNSGLDILDRFHALAADSSLQHFAIELQADIQAGRLPNVGNVDLAKLDYRELYTRYANPED